jgi:two-component system alkaline phosphatase synthesis response regulator PhoP
MSTNETVQKILVVDDEPLIRQLNADILADAGFRVDTAGDGAAAWDALQICGYDLVITDNQMPKVSGVELIEKIRVAGLVLPIIMASATLPEDGYIEHLWLQPFAMLLKPYSLAEFVGTVKAILHAAGDAGEMLTLMPNWQSHPLSFGVRL